MSSTPTFVVCEIFLWIIFFVYLAVMLLQIASS